MKRDKRDRRNKTKREGHANFPPATEKEGRWAAGETAVTRVPVRPLSFPPYLPPSLPRPSGRLRRGRRQLARLPCPRTQAAPPGRQAWSTLPNPSSHLAHAMWQHSLRALIAFSSDLHEGHLEVRCHLLRKSAHGIAREHLRALAAAVQLSAQAARCTSRAQTHSRAGNRRGLVVPRESRHERHTTNLKGPGPK